MNQDIWIEYYLEALRKGNLDELFKLAEANIMKKSIVVYDLDGVLLEREPNSYDKSVFVSKVNHSQLAGFKQLKQDLRFDVCILTARKISQAMEINYMFDCQVFSRDFFLDKKLVSRLKTEPELKQEFDDKVTEFKFGILKILSRSYKLVVFVDDHIDRYKSQSCRKNIVLCSIHEFDEWRLSIA